MRSELGGNLRESHQQLPTQDANCDVQPMANRQRGGKWVHRSESGFTQLLLNLKLRRVLGSPKVAEGVVSKGGMMTMWCIGRANGDHGGGGEAS